ncbi:MAG: aspartate aminotransferase family protein [Cellulomonadaceae bacterium]
MVTLAQYRPYLSPALAKATDLVVTSGSGSYLTDVDGRRFLDFVQGIAVNALGHCHPRVVHAVQEQAAQLLTASFNMVNYPTTLELARRIAEIAPGQLGSTFFSNGGAEAVDGAIKLARAATRRPAIIAFKGSFHGRTIGATSVTASNSKYRKHYEPLMGGVHFATYPSADLCPPGFDEDQRTEFALAELQRLFDYVVAPETVAAILMEPIQGEGGYVVPTREFVQAIRAVCDEHGILLIFDEIQAGYGRTGQMFASEHFDVVPDIMTLGKAIAGGVPMSAVVSTPDIMSSWLPGMHGGTFGGNPVAAAAALAVLDEFEENDVLGNAQRQGAYLAERLRELAAAHPVVTDVRGLGMMLAIELNHTDGRPGGDLVQAVQRDCFEHGLLILSCGVKGNGIRIAAPLNVTRAELDEGLDILDAALDRADVL